MLLAFNNGAADEFEKHELPTKRLLRPKAHTLAAAHMSRATASIPPSNRLASLLLLLTD